MSDEEYPCPDGVDRGSFDFFLGELRSAVTGRLACPDWKGVCEYALSRLAGEPPGAELDRLRAGRDAAVREMGRTARDAGVREGELLARLAVLGAAPAPPAEPGAVPCPEGLHRGPWDVFIREFYRVSLDDMRREVSVTKPLADHVLAALRAYEPPPPPEPEWPIRREFIGADGDEYAVEIEEGRRNYLSLNCYVPVEDAERVAQFILDVKAELDRRKGGGE